MGVALVLPERDVIWSVCSSVVWMFKCCGTFLSAFLSQPMMGYSLIASLHHTHKSQLPCSSPFWGYRRSATALCRKWYTWMTYVFQVNSLVWWVDVGLFFFLVGGSLSQQNLCHINMLKRAGVWQCNGEGVSSPLVKWVLLNQVMVEQFYLSLVVQISIALYIVLFVWLYPSPISPHMSWRRRKPLI